MSSTVQQSIPRANPIVSTMKALVFRGTDQIGIEHVPIPKARSGRSRHSRDADHDLRDRPAHSQGRVSGEPGLVIGHEPVGVIHELGVGVTGYKIGDRVLVGAITPCGQCNFLPQRDIGRNAAAPSAAGNLATASTARRPNICWCRTLKPTWRRFLMS